MFHVARSSQPLRRKKYDNGNLCCDVLADHVLDNAALITDDAGHHASIYKVKLLVVVFGN
jgi:hypothetical protein